MEPQKIKEQDQLNGNEDEQTKRRDTLWMVRLTGVIAISTALYTVFSLLLWLATQRSVKLTEKSIELTEKSLQFTQESLDFTKRSTEKSLQFTQESLDFTKMSVNIAENSFNIQYRPYLGMSEIRVEKGEKSVLYTIFVPIKNFGAIPAHNIDIKMNSFSDGVPIPVTYRLGFSGLVLFPGETHEVSQWMSENLPGGDGMVFDFILATYDVPKVSEFEVNITYEGIGQQKYHTYGKWQWQKNLYKENQWGLSPTQQTYK